MPARSSSTLGSARRGGTDQRQDTWRAHLMKTRLIYKRLGKVSEPNETTVSLLKKLLTMEDPCQ